MKSEAQEKLEMAYGTIRKMLERIEILEGAICDYCREETPLDFGQDGEADKRAIEWFIASAGNVESEFVSDTDCPEIFEGTKEALDCLGVSKE